MDQTSSGLERRPADTTPRGTTWAWWLIRSELHYKSKLNAACVSRQSESTLWLHIIAFILEIELYFYYYHHHHHHHHYAGIRVPTRQRREFSSFSVSIALRHNPLARWAIAANDVCRSDIFSKNNIYFSETFFVPETVQIVYLHLVQLRSHLFLFNIYIFINVCLSRRVDTDKNSNKGMELLFVPVAVLLAR
jgi:hypothetical protein